MQTHSERIAFFKEYLASLKSTAIKKEGRKPNPVTLIPVEMGATVTLDELLEKGLAYKKFPVFADSSVEQAVNEAKYLLDGETGTHEEFWEAYNEMGPDELPGPQQRPHLTLGLKAGFRELIFNWFSVDQAKRRFFFKGENPWSVAAKRLVIPSEMLKRAEVKRAKKEKKLEKKEKKPEKRNQILVNLIRKENKVDSSNGWWADLIEQKRQEFLEEKRKEREMLQKQHPPSD